MPSRRTYLCACTAALAGCLDAPREDSTSTPSPASDSTPTDTPTPVPSGSTAWRRSLSGAVEHAPVLAGEHLLVGTDDGTVASVRKTDGSVAWEVAFDAPVQAVAVAGDAVLTVTGRTALHEHHAVTALERTTGERRWRFAPEEWWLEVHGSDGTAAYIGTNDDNVQDDGQSLYAVDLADGAERWSVEVGDQQGGLLADGTVYLPAYGVVDAVATTGERRWQYGPDEYQYATLAVAGDTVALVTGGSPETWTVRGLAADAGDERWTFDDWPAHTTRADGDRLFVGGERVARLDPATGGVAWTADQRAALYDAPVADGRLYVATDGAAAIDVADGTVRWSTPLNGYLTSPAGLATGRLVVHRSASRDDRDRHLVALEAADGTEAWRFTGDSPLTTPILDDRRAYVADGSDLLALAV
jgi:outer membrane protein assembly factor BamB